MTSIAELKALRLHGMAGAWADLLEQGTSAEPGAIALAGRASAAGRDAPTAPCARSATRCTRPSSRCIAIWPASTSSVSPVDRKLVDATGRAGVHRRRAQRRVGRRTRHRQDASGDRHRRGRHHAARQARALLLDGRSGQRAGAGEGPRQGRAHRREPAAHGPGHPRRAGLPALQPGRRRAAVPPAQPSSTSTPAW